MPLRITLFAVALAAGACAAWFTLSSRDTRPDPAVTRLRFWHGFTGKDGEVMLDLVRQFNREHTDVQVTVQRMPWHVYYNKLFVAGRAGREPEVFVAHTIALARLARARFVRPVDDLALGGSRLPVDDLLPQVWDAVAVDGRHVGVPLDVHPAGMFYNRALLREAGLVDARGEPQPPRNWAEFVCACRKLNRDTDGDGRIDRWGFAFEGTPSIALLSIMDQFDGALLSADQRHATLASPANIRALELARELTVTQRLVPRPEEDTGWAAFLHGRVGMFFGGIFLLRSLQTQSTIDFAAAPLPQFGPKPGVWADSHVLCLSAGAAPAKAAAAWRFITFLSDHSAAWAAAGQLPVRRSLLESAEFKQLSTHAVFAEQLPHIRYSPDVPFSFELLREVRFAFDRVLRGAATPAEALRAADDSIGRMLARERALHPPAVASAVGAR